MNDFTKEELKYLLMTMKPLHFLAKQDPLELESKLKYMIDNYCDHEVHLISALINYCPKCDKGEFVDL